MDIFKIKTEEDYLKNKDKVDINKIEPLNDMNALFVSNSEKIEWLIKNGIDLHKKDKYGQNALYISGKNECEVLINAGLDVNSKDNDGRTALFFSDSKEKTQLLVEKGADITILDKYGFSPLMFLELESQDFLIDKNINLSILNHRGENAFFYLKNANTVKILVDKKIDINLLNKSSQNALYVYANNIDKVKQLIKHGININNIDKFGNNSLVYASEKVFKLLIKEGIDVSIYTKEKIKDLLINFSDDFTVEKQKMIEEEKAKIEKENILSKLSIDKNDFNKLKRL